MISEMSDLEFFFRYELFDFVGELLFISVIIVVIVIGLILIQRKYNLFNISSRGTTAKSILIITAGLYAFFQVMFVLTEGSLNLLLTDSWGITMFGFIVGSVVLNILMFFTVLLNNFMEKRTLSLRAQILYIIAGSIGLTLLFSLALMFL